MAVDRKDLMCGLSVGMGCLDGTGRHIDDVV